MRKTILTAILAVSCSLPAMSRPPQHTFTVGKAEIMHGEDSPLFHPDKLYWGEGVISSGATEIVAMQQTLSSGTSLADIRAITYEDGAPVIEDGKLYISASTRTAGSGIAILALTLGTGELEFTGTVTSLMQGKFWKIAAPHIMYDRGRKLWQVTTPYHSPANHLLWVATAFNDLRFGVTTLDFKSLDYEKPMRGDEDCQIFYDGEMRKWIMIYASTRQSDGSAGEFILRLQTSDSPDGGFKDYSYQTGVSATGVTTTIIGGKRYVLSGNQRSEEANRYSVWSYPEMEFVCDLDIDIDDGASRSWNNLTPVPEGNGTRYVLMGFDRQASTDEDNWTYGNNYFLYSRQRNPGLEFPMKDGNGNVLREASTDFPVQVQDLQMLRRGSRRIAFQDILLGKIDLEYDITTPRGNVYPSIVGPSLIYDGGCLKLPAGDRNDAAILAGIHHPLANYIMPLDGIADGDSRYLYIGSKEGECAAKVIATRIASNIRVSFDSGADKPVKLGTFFCPAENSHKLRIAFSISNLTGKFSCFVFCHCNGGIDRQSVISRNNPHVTALDTLASLSVGNGGFAVTVDVTGLQTWPEKYSGGVSLGTMSDWGWHSFPNPEGYRFEEVLKPFDFGRASKEELYACQFPPGRQNDAADWFRINPHRLHLGLVGFEDLSPEEISGIDQTLDIWKGVIRSSFSRNGKKTSVGTCVAPGSDMMCVSIDSQEILPVSLRFAYPTGEYDEEYGDWTKDNLHSTKILSSHGGVTVLERSLDDTKYYVTIRTEGASKPRMAGPNKVVVTPKSGEWSFSVEYSHDLHVRPSGYEDAFKSTASWWNEYWQSGAIVDFGRCTDPRAPELERRVVLSQYLTAIQCAGDNPPQETGLTYNSWHGKPHLEMTWWHQVHFAYWGHPEILSRTMSWLEAVAPVARDIARRQGMDGLRWMKMTDPSGREAPSNTGSFLIWQQPHYIYYAELLRRSGLDVSAYEGLVQETAECMASLLTYEPEKGRYVLQGCIPAQEATFAVEKTVNPPYELAYWRYALCIAQQWRERAGKPRDPLWDDMIERISPLASKDGLYLGAESEPDTYSIKSLYSDHMSVLAAIGILPDSPLADRSLMKNTLDWVMDNWNWDKTWGWDFPMTSMTAARLGLPVAAVDALLMDTRTNTYLPNGHNYQNSTLRLYLPGNGGLLTAVALMCAGWEGCTQKNPGFPKDGSWDVRWEGLLPQP